MLSQIPGRRQPDDRRACRVPIGQSGDNQVTVLCGPGGDTLGTPPAIRRRPSPTWPADGRIYVLTYSFAEGLKAVTADGSYDSGLGR